MAATQAEIQESKAINGIYYDKNREKFRVQLCRNKVFYIASCSNTLEEAKEKLAILVKEMPAKNQHGNSYIKPDWFTKEWYFEQKRMKVTSKSIASLLHITVRTLENWTKEWRTKSEYCND